MAASRGKSIEQVLAQVRPKTTTVRVCLRGDLLGEHERLERELAEARRLDLTENRHAEAPAVAAKVADVERQIDASQVEFTFTAVGQKAWTDLLVRHRPDEEDREQRYEFNPRTFPQAAIALSCSSPAMTPEQAEQLYEALNFGQWQKLWAACMAANVEGTDVPFSAAASVILRGSETKSASPAPLVSVEAS